MWVLLHLDDLASDLSAIHGIRDMTRLTGPVFFKLAYRIGAYGNGVMCRVAEQLVADAAQRQQAAAAPIGQPGRVEVPSTPAAIAADPVLSKLVSFA